MHKFNATILLGSFAFGLSSCGGGGSSSKTSVDSATRELLTLSSQGGQVATRNGAVSLTFPFGAVTGTRRIAVVSQPRFPEGVRVAGGTSFTLTDIDLASPVTLTLAYSAARLPVGAADADLAIYRLEGSSWTLVGGKVDPQAHTVTSTIDAFGTFAVLAPDPTSVIAEPVLDNGGSPMVRITWNPQKFSHPGGTPVRWQVYRNDRTMPIKVVDGTSLSWEEGLYATPVTFDDYADFDRTGGIERLHRTPGNKDYDPSPPVVLGRPYVFQTQMVYSKSYEGSSDVYYYLSGKGVSGQATPLAGPRAVAPLQGTSAVIVDFEFIKSGGAEEASLLEYVVEISSGSFKDPKVTYRSAPLLLRGAGVETYTMDLSKGPRAILGEGPVRWRVGVRNRSDRPGPAPDRLSGLRYLYGSPAYVKMQGPGAP